MVSRLFDIILSFISLIILSPVFCIAAIGIRLSSSGPVLYRAERVGCNQKIFNMYKFRTMHTNQRSLKSVITAKDDPRIFLFGSWLRHLKIDELPQLINILKGEMSIVGPRAEDPRIVYNYYAPEHFETLRVLPGLASPGSIYNYTHGEQLINRDNPEKYYIEKLLPVKLALDIVYVHESSFLYDLKIIFRTILVILLISFGWRRFHDPPEMKRAKKSIYSLVW